MTVAATDRSELPPSDGPGGLTLHEPRTLEGLCEEMTARLGALLGEDAAAAVLLETDRPDAASVELVWGERCPLALGETVEPDRWRPEGAVDLDLRYRGQRVGLLRSESPGGRDASALQPLLDHYTVALVNLKLNRESLRSADHYSASLQAFEEGVILFQEPDRDVVGARFLSLVAKVFGCQASALFLLDHIGDPGSELVFAESLGIPEMMLDHLRTSDGEWWPPTILGEPAAVAAWRDSGGKMAGLDGDRLPPAMRNIVSVPLRHHGILAGLCLAFNVDTADSAFRDKLENVSRLGKLGAAVYHRLRLEQEALRSRELDTQLQIAGAIQSRLLPTEHPRTERLQCAWHSEPAQTIGGDYFDALSFDSGDVFAVVADVSGHGIDSALLMTSFRAACRAECVALPPDALLTKLNDVVGHEVGATGMFITAVAFAIAADGRSCRYASAGHNSVLHYRAAQDAIGELESTGPSLGFFPGIDYDLGEVELAPGDVLVLYTDGIVEATDAADEMFGDERLHDCVRENHARSADEIQAAIRDRLARFVARDAREDDVTLAVLKVV